MSITRANPYLEEIIKILDEHLAICNGDKELARDRLSAADNEWIDQEVLHCMTDSRYFISNYYAYRDEKEGFKGLYPFFDSQEILHQEYDRLWELYGKVRALVLKARQMGSTTYNCARFFWATIFSEHINGLIGAQDEDAQVYIMGMYESALDFIPWWMKPRTKTNITGKQITFDERDDSIRMQRPGLKTSIYAENANKPSGIGRTKTFGRALLSELAFWKDGKQLSKALFPTFNTPDGFYVLESTANGRNDHWHNLWRRAEAGKVDWHPIFIPWYRRPKTYSLPVLKTEVFVVSKDEAAFRERVFEKESVLISDDMLNWMRNKKEEFTATDGDDSMFSQEYTSEPEESFQSSAITAFPRGLINRFTKRTIDPLWVGEIKYDFDRGQPVCRGHNVEPGENVPYPETEQRLHVWAWPVKGERYTLGVDVSLGTEGNDFSVVQVVKTPEGHEKDEQVAVWHGYVHPIALAEIVYALGFLYNEAMAAVEVNSMGMATNSELTRVLEYENVYRFKRLDRIKNVVTDIMGFWSDYKSCQALHAAMATSFMDDTIIIRDRYTMDEFNDYTEDGAQGDGAHDDYVVALMIAIYCGHEAEVGRRQRGKKHVEIDEAANIFRVKDRFGSIIMETNSQNEAERFSGKHVGSTIDREARATAHVTLAGKKFKVPADYQNTEFSPVHDKEGTARKLHYEENIPAEDIDRELMDEYEAREQQMDNSPDAWKYY